MSVTGRLRDPRRLRHGDLTVLYDPMPGPLTAIAIAVRAGSRTDGRLAGLAHMAEHMLFQGTRRLDQLTINRRAGELLGRGTAAAEIPGLIGQASEGLDSVPLIAETVLRFGISAPGLEGLAKLIAGEISPGEWMAHVRRAERSRRAA